jgi:hypothetical protein
MVYGVVAERYPKVPTNDAFMNAAIRDLFKRSIRNDYSVKG